MTEPRAAQLDIGTVEADMVETASEFDFGANLEGKAARTYRQLVDASREILRDTANFRVNDIAAHAGVATATVYTYFPTKANIVAAAFDDLLAEGHAITSAELDIAAVLTDGLDAVIGRMLRRTSEIYRRDGGLMRLALSEVNHDPIIRSIMRRHEVEGLAHLERFLVLCREAGKVKADRPRDLAVASLLIMESMTNATLSRAEDTEVVAGYLESAVCHILRGGPDSSGSTGDPGDERS